MISIIIPALNEEASVSDAVDSSREFLKQHGLEEGEVIVVDDGSSDQTSRLAAEAGAVVIKNPITMGYGHSIKRGIRCAQNNWIGITDCDGTYPIDKFSSLWQEIESGFHMAVGARTGKYLNSDIRKKLLRKSLKALAEFVGGKEIPDVNSGFRIFSKHDAIRFDTKLCDTFSYSTSITLAYVMNGLPVSYVPIEYKKRLGKSKVRLLRDSFLTFIYILQASAFYNPFKIFLLFAALAFLMSAFFFATGFVLQILTGFTIGAGLFLIGFLFVGFGLIAEILRHLLAPSPPSEPPSTFS